MSYSKGWRANLFKNASAMFGILIDVDCIKKLKLYLAVKVIWIVILDEMYECVLPSWDLVAISFWLSVQYGLKEKFHAQRTCTLCNRNDIEDEYQLTLVCEYFRNVRKKNINHSIIRHLIWRNFLIQWPVLVRRIALDS